MKLKINHVPFLFILLIIMTLNIDKESIKLNIDKESIKLNIDKESIKLTQIVNDDKFDFLEFSKQNKMIYFFPHIEFLWLVLKLTIKYPQVEPYLKNVLNYFTINELKMVFGGSTMLHFMCRFPFNISLNAFEIIINYGVNINIKSEYNNVEVHNLLYNRCDNHIHNILNFLIKYGIDLNIINFNKNTGLDVLINVQPELDEATKNCIMTIVDFGGITNNAIKNNNVIYDFVECYKYSSIKPAIKK